MNQPSTFNMGLSEEEKNDLEKMIGDFQQNRSIDCAADDSIQKQIEAINKRMACLTNMVLALDRRIKPLYEITRLLLEKNEISNQRIDAIIDASLSGDPL